MRFWRLVLWPSRVKDEMANDRFGPLIEADCVNVLRAGVAEPPEFEKGSWRYRVNTNRICVVVAFRSETYLVVVTTWRKIK